MGADGAFRKRLAEGGVVFDGGMGSMLIAAGLAPGHASETWNLLRPDAVLAIHRDYREAGAEVITTNTFGATPARMARHGLDLADVNRAGVSAARQAAGDEAFVALSLGPTGMMLPPVGVATGKDIEREFAGQLESLDGGFDLVLVETMFDLNEALIALRAARERTDVPVVVTMTFSRTPRGFFTFMGNPVPSAMTRLQDGGADAVGANCTVASGDMLELAPLLRAAAERPVLCQPNAGAPRTDGEIPVYDQTPEKFAGEAARLFDLGINAVGGCCGTTPEFIRALCALRERTAL